MIVSSVRPGIVGWLLTAAPIMMVLEPGAARGGVPQQIVEFSRDVAALEAQLQAAITEYRQGSGYEAALARKIDYGRAVLVRDQAERRGAPESVRENLRVQAENARKTCAAADAAEERLTRIQQIGFEAERLYERNLETRRELIEFGRRLDEAVRARRAIDEFEASAKVLEARIADSAEAVAKQTGDQRTRGERLLNSAKDDLTSLRRTIEQLRSTTTTLGAGLNVAAGRPDDGIDWESLLAEYRKQCERWNEAELGLRDVEAAVRQEVYSAPDVRVVHFFGLVLLSKTTGLARVTEPGAVVGALDALSTSEGGRAHLAFECGESAWIASKTQFHHEIGENDSPRRTYVVTRGAVRLICRTLPLKARVQTPHGGGSFQEADLIVQVENDAADVFVRSGGFDFADDEGTVTRVDAGRRIRMSDGKINVGPVAFEDEEFAVLRRRAFSDLVLP